MALYSIESFLFSLYNLIFKKVQFFPIRPFCINLIKAVIA